MRIINPILSTLLLGSVAACATGGMSAGESVTRLEQQQKSEPASAGVNRSLGIAYYKANFNENEGLPIDHVVHNGAFFGRADWNITPKSLFYASYNFDYSRNPNQTFDVATYGTSANGIEGAAHISTLNFNLDSTLSDHALNEAHVTYGYETRPRSAINGSAVPDTGIGFFPSFRFGQPFFLGPGASETFYHIDPKDNFTLIHGRHTFKFGKTKIPCFSDNAVTVMKAALIDVGMDAVWKARKG